MKVLVSDVVELSDGGPGAGGHQSRGMRDPRVHAQVTGMVSAKVMEMVARVEAEGGDVLRVTVEVIDSKGG